MADSTARAGTGPEAASQESQSLDVFPGSSK